MRLRRGGLPREVRRSLQLAGGERVLATGRSVDGSYTVATNHALHARGSRLPYEEIVKVVWLSETATLEVRASSSPSGRMAIMLDEPGRVPETVRERVQGTIVISRHMPLRGDRGVVVTARRSPSDGRIRWTMMFDSGLDSKDRTVRADAEAALADIRDRAGI